MLSREPQYSKAGHAPHVARERENASKIIDKADKRSVIEMTDLKITFKEHTRSIHKGPYVLLC